ncbi:MAG: MSMEG_0568 family radical SAM protein [Planctomycetota bacterium]
MQLPVVDRPPVPVRRDLLTELQSAGVRLEDDPGAPSRRGGAGPSDHKAVTVDGTTVMIPVHTGIARFSPFVIRRDLYGHHTLEREGQFLARVTFPPAPKFYEGVTADGVPYWKIAVLHSSDVLATTVMQTCIRYRPVETSCQFCAIGQSLEAKRTIARKTPEQLAEVAAAAVRLDGVRHMIMTTGTPNRTDRGAAVLTDSAAAVTAAVDLPIQAQCEPPDDFAWFGRLRDAGVVSLGMHLEAVEPHVRARIMPGKAEVPLDVYMDAFAAAVDVFGRAQVSTYILAGLGDSLDAIDRMAADLVAIGVYPFVVPFVPISGTPLADHAEPDAAFMKAVLTAVGRRLKDAGMTSADMKAGCGKCGACSSLSAYETDSETRPAEPVYDAVF